MFMVSLHSTRTVTKIHIKNVMWCPVSPPRPGFHFPSASATGANLQVRAALGARGPDALGARGVAPELRLQLQQLPADPRSLTAPLTPPPAPSGRASLGAAVCCCSSGRWGRGFADLGPAARTCGCRETSGSRPCLVILRLVLLGPVGLAASVIAGGRRRSHAGLQPGVQNYLPGRPLTTT